MALTRYKLRIFHAAYHESRGAKGRPAQAQIGSDCRDITFVHARPRSMENLPMALIAVRDHGVLIEEHAPPLPRAASLERSAMKRSTSAFP